VERTDLLSEHDQLEADSAVAPEWDGDQVDKRPDHGIDDRLGASRYSTPKSM
jgi:hypothetical protein